MEALIPLNLNFKIYISNWVSRSGVGLRFDFNYFLIRFDIGFRFKRPDVIKNDGWQIPDITFKNLFGNALENRLWRYENFNATIGIDYPF